MDFSLNNIPGRDIKYSFYIWDFKILPKTTHYIFKSITVTFQPPSFTVEDHCIFYFRGFQWAFDVTESKGFDWLFGLDCACWAWAFSSSSRASSCFPWPLLLYFTFKISFHPTVFLCNWFPEPLVGKVWLSRIYPCYVNLLTPGFYLQSEKVFIPWNMYNFSAVELHGYSSTMRHGSHTHWILGFSGYETYLLLY